MVVITRIFKWELFRGLALRRLTIQNMRIVEFEKWRSFGLLFFERIDEAGAVCKKQINK